MSNKEAKHKKSSIIAYFQLFLILQLFSIHSIGQALNGTYTIGGSNPDYVSLTAAATALNSNGISGDVIFNVRSGEYSEQFKINQISGSSANARILFQSESGNAEDVLIKHQHTSWTNTANYTLYVDGTDHITFKNLSFQAIKNRDYNRVLFVTANADYVTFDSNRFISWYETNTFLNRHDAITIENSRHIRFMNNYIEGGNTGIYIGGQDTTNDWVIDGNTLVKQYATGIKTSRGTDIHILNNTIETQDGFESYFFNGMELSQARDSITVEKNIIDLKKGGRGIYIHSCSSTGRKAATIANNMIAIGPTSVSGAHRRGIYTSQNDTIGIYYNAINIEGPGNTGEIIYSFGDDTLLLYNNMLTHLGGGKIYYSTNTSNTILIADYNNVFNSNQTIAQLSGTTYNSLSNLQSLKNIDLSSFALDPLYIRRDYLISTNPSVYERGTPIQEITTDYFGNQRSSVQTDVGVFEGTIPSVDAGLSYSSLTAYYSCPGDSFPVYAKIKNIGLTTLTSANINLYINDSIYSINWTGSLGRYQTSPNILVGYVQPSANSKEDWKSWTSLPNGIQDSLPVNDTLYGTIFNSMKGHYIIGPSPSANYSSLEKAIQDLQLYGVCDSVFLDIEPGIYDEQIVVPKILGTSATSPLIIQSLNRDSSSATYRYFGTSSRNYVFLLDGAEHTYIRDLTIYSRSSSYNIAIDFINDCQNIKIHNNYIQGRTAQSFADRSLIHMDFSSIWNTAPTNIEIANNLFYSGGNQIFINGRNNLKPNNIVIKNNHFYQCSIGIKAEYFSNLYVRSNRFSDYMSISIDLNYSTGDLEIEKNQFFIKGSLSVNAIWMEDCFGTASNPIEVTNNFFAVDASSSATAIRLYNIGHYNIYHNNFNSINSIDFLIKFNGNVNNLNVKNNLFYSSNMGRFYTTNILITPAIFSSDYNSFYTTNSNLFHLNGVDQDFLGWKTITNNDQNSILFDPLYTSDSNLHVNNTIPLNGKGLVLTSVTDDIDGDTRSNPPDMGADEFDIDSTQYYDLEISGFPRHDSGYCVKSDSIFMSIVNHSNFMMDSFITKWGLLNGSLDSQKWFISILPKDTITILLDTFDFTRNTAYKFDIRIEKPNGKNDNVITNNNRILNYEALDEIIIHSKQAPYCATDTELYIENYPHQSILWSNAQIENNIIVTSGTYSVTLIDNNGCSFTDTITVP